jgi:hypothetical protein
MLAASKGRADVMKARTLLAAAAVVLATASPGAAASSVRVTFTGTGQVSLTADGATPAEILAEWARVGGTRIVNAERAAGAAMTLELRDVPELEALEIVLRSAGGFIVSSRALEQTAAARLSSVEQVSVLAASGRPATPSLPALPPTPPPPPIEPVFDASGARRLIGPDGQPVPDDQEGAPPPPPQTPSAR